jgi:hypothetical protein
LDGDFTCGIHLLTHIGVPGICLRKNSIETKEFLAQHFPAADDKKQRRLLLLQSSVSIPFLGTQTTSETRHIVLSRLLKRATQLICLLLAAFASLYSGLCAWTVWELRQPGFGLPQIERARALGLNLAGAWIRLADREPLREKEHLLAAVQADPRSSDALIRLALLAEIERDLPRATRYYMAATEVDKRYPIFLAAASFGARAGEQALVTRFAQLAFEYRPRDLFNLFAVLTTGTTRTGIASAEKVVLQLASLPQQIEFLYFLIGQEEYDRAFDFQNLLPPTEATLEGARRELSERLLLHGDPAKAWRLWQILAPGARSAEIQNARFDTKPSSLAFDWRLTHEQRVGFDAQPGGLTVRIEELSAPVEVMSQIVFDPDGKRLPRVDVDWQGDLTGLDWQVERVGGKESLLRLSLQAKPGPARRLTIAGVQVRSF